MGNCYTQSNEPGLLKELPPLRVNQPATAQELQTTGITSSKSVKFNICDLIRTKKEGGELSKEMIDFYINGVVDQSIPDYQITPLLMAMCLRSCNVRERSLLTLAMSKSGKTMNFNDLGRYIVDKHSTGGIGDKTSIILAPLVAEIGLNVPMVTGRGLGHTGGTTDKLETIPGYRCDLSNEQFHSIISQCNCFIGTQTNDVAPADKRIYALRDISETVKDITLITASILSKKFAEGLNGLTMDIKCGSGAFMQTFQEAEALARSIVNTSNDGGVKCEALITRMDYPLGIQVGNVIEVWECVQAMTPNSDYVKILREKISFDNTSECYLRLSRHESPKDALVFITTALAINMLTLSGMAAVIAYTKVVEAWSSGRVLERFKRMVALQSGDFNAFEKRATTITDFFTKNASSQNVLEYRVTKSCKIKRVDGQKIGRLMVNLGAGRKLTTDIIDGEVSMEWYVVPNQQLNIGDVICRIYHPKPQVFQELNTRQSLDEAIEFTTDVLFIDSDPLVYKRIV